MIFEHDVFPEHFEIAKEILKGERCYFGITEFYLELRNCGKTNYLCWKNEVSLKQYIRFVMRIATTEITKNQPLRVCVGHSRRRCGTCGF